MIASLSRSSLYSRTIALAGFMGVGKSTVGRLLSDVLERPFYDTDGVVEASTGRSVDSFFPAGEPEFRRHEAEAVATLLGQGPSVIALGGGALLDDRSRALLLRGSLLVHLHVPWPELRQHVPALIASRPLLRGKSLAEIHRLYLVRLATYRQASLRITIGREGVGEAAAIVLRALTASEPDGASDSKLAGPDRTALTLRALARIRTLDGFEVERTV